MGLKGFGNNVRFGGNVCITEGMKGGSSGNDVKAFGNGF
jgi:hypothetical protein